MNEAFETSVNKYADLVLRYNDALTKEIHAESIPNDSHNSTRGAPSMGEVMGVAC